MLLSKLITLLRTIDDESMERLRDFVHSPYFKVPAASVSLFDYLYKLYPEYPEKKIQVKNFAKYSANISTSAKIGRAGTHLLEAVEQFLAVDSVSKDKYMMDFHLFQALKKKDLMIHYHSNFKKLMDGLEKAEISTIDKFYYKHLFTEFSQSGYDAVLNRTISNSLQPTIQTLNEYFSVKHLFHLCEAISRKQILGTEVEQAPVDFMFTVLDRYNNEDNPEVYLNINSYLLASCEDFEESVKYHDKIKSYFDKLDSSHLPYNTNFIIVGCINWCLYWNNKGYEKSIREYLWWIDYRIKHNLLLDNGKITPITYRNVINMSILSDIDPRWSLTFINTYSKYLPDELREVNVNFAMALYFFKTGEYAKSNQYFQLVDPKNEPIFSAIIRRYHFMALYEDSNDDYDLLFSFLQSFERYLQRHLVDFHQLHKAFTTFISYSKRLIKSREEKDFGELIFAVNDEPYFPGKPWILQALNKK